MIKAIIIEDEKKSREVLSKLIEKNCPDIQLLGMAEGVESGMNLVNQTNPDLIFLDIAMPDGSGFDLLEKVSGKNFDVIFTTATDKYAIKAIKYSALDYLLKPIDADELKIAVGKIKARPDLPNMENLKFLLENIKMSDEQYTKITIPTGNAYEIILIKDIVRCEATENYTYFYMSDKRKFLATGNMKHFEDLLPQKDFIRVHHSHLININHVVRYLKEDSGYAIMSDGSKVEVSRRKRDDFFALLEKLR